MARLFDDASSDYLVVNSTPVTAAPLSMACWFRSNDADIYQSLMSVCSNSSNQDYFSLRAAGEMAGDPVVADTRATGGPVVAQTTTGYSVNTWHHACGVWAAHDDRHAYIDGGSKGTNGLSRTPSGINRVGLGVLARSSFYGYLSGWIAEAAIWNVALSDDEVKALAGGVSPLRVHAANLKAYWPIFGVASPEPDYSGNGYHLTVNGTTIADHAPVGPMFGWDAEWQGAGGGVPLIGQARPVHRFVHSGVHSRVA